MRYAMSYQPAGLLRDAGSGRNSVSQLLLRQSGACLSARLFLGDLLPMLRTQQPFPSDFCGMPNLSVAVQPWEPAWSSAGVGVLRVSATFGSFPFLPLTPSSPNRIFLSNALFKDSVSIQIFLVLTDHFPSCCDFPGMGQAVLIYTSWR